MTSVFMGSGVLFAAFVSSSGAAQELVRLSIVGAVRLVVSQDVVTETRRNFRMKAPAALAPFEQLLKALDLDGTADPTQQEVRSGAAYVADRDAFIIAAAQNAGVDHLATFAFISLACAHSPQVACQ